MTKEQAARFYAQEYEKTHEATEFFERQRALEADLYLAPFLVGVKTLLDYGCGPGGKLTPLVHRGIDVYGFDLNPHFLSFAESKGLRRWDPQRRYDCIFLSHTLEHWIEPRKDLAALLASNLVPGGRVIIELPLVERLVLGDRRGGFFEETHLAHVWYFSTPTLSEMLSTMHCALTFSDRVTTCVFQHCQEGALRRAHASPAVERLRLGFIELSKSRVGARVSGLLNRQFNYIDTGFRARTIRSQRRSG